MAYIATATTTVTMTASDGSPVTFSLTNGVALSGAALTFAPLLVQDGLASWDGAATPIPTYHTGLEFPDWATNTYYPVGSLIADPTGKMKRAVAAHTSGTYATDLAAGKWADPFGPYAPLPTATRNALTGWWHLDGYGVDTSGSSATAAANRVALQAALDAAAAAGGGIVYCPAGSGSTPVVMLDAPVTIPANVWLTGPHGRGYIFRATTGFVGTQMFRIGPGGTGAIFNCGLRSVGIDCNDHVARGVYSTQINEEAGIVDCVISRYTSKGAFIDCRVDHADNFILRDLEFYGSAVTPSAAAMHVQDAGSKFTVQNVTVNAADGATKQGIGLWVNSASGASVARVYGLHGENHADVVLVDTGGELSGVGIGGILQADGDSILHIKSTRAVEVMGLDKASTGGVGYIVNDESNGYKSKAAYKRHYGIAPSIGVTAGLYYGASTGQLGTVNPAVDRISAVPIQITEVCTLASIAIHVATAGGAGSTAKLGIYADNGNGFPGALLVDGGSVSTAASGEAENAVTATLTPGLYWLAYLDKQVTSAPLVTAVSSGRPMSFGGRSLVYGPGGAAGGFFSNGVGSSLPATWPGAIGSVWQTPPYVVVKFA